MSPAKQLRVLILLLLLLPLVIVAFWERDPRPEWTDTLTVGVYPYNADDSPEVRRHLEMIDSDHFDPVEAWLTEQAARYRLPLDRPFEIRLGHRLAQAPPLPPRAGSYWQRLKWAVNLRWWHWRLATGELEPDIVLVARYSTVDGQHLDLHSIGMSSPRLGLVSLSVSERLGGLNHVMLAHELLHTVNAPDLYDSATGLPQFPNGYAAPNETPLYPQPAAEIMAGRIPVGPESARQARSLAQCLIGQRTARDIGWLH
ncbi:MAG: hypothetical protein GVY32_11340 [Gammaproteobacteria bacterium]|nr:hypothetical protein [Gammaproteobacteria bacterium]